MRVYRFLHKAISYQPSAISYQLFVLTTDLIDNSDCTDFLFSV